MIAYAVMAEGNIDSFITKNGRGIIVATSYWPTREQAQAAIDRTFTNFGRWTPRARWIEERDIDPNKLTVLAHNAPEYSTR